MPVESDADRAALLDSDEFGVVVLVGGNNYDGIIDREYDEAGDAIAPIQSSQPRIWMRDIDIAAESIEIGSSITAGGVPYGVNAVQPDGVGLSLLILRGSV